MATTKSNLTVYIGRMEFNCTIEWSYNPGEPMVRYYADGSGYPGSPPEFDYIESVECNECEWPVGRTDEWRYAAREDRPDAFATAERWIYDNFEELSSVDELFDHAG